MKNSHTRRGYTQHINVGQALPDHEGCFCPPCGESQGQRPQSRKVGMRELGKGVLTLITLHRPFRPLPPQGRK